VLRRGEAVEPAA